MASIPMKPMDAPVYERLSSNTGNGPVLRDEEKQTYTKKVGTVYHTTNSGTVLDGANPDNFHFPTSVPSMWEWASADSQIDDSSHGYKDLVPSGATEFVGSMLFSLVVNTAISLFRGTSSPPYVTWGLFPYAIAITAGLTYMFIHSTMWMHSVNLFPAISIVEFFSPHSWRRYSGKSNTGSRWPQAAAMLAVQLVAQFIGTLFGTWVAFEIEDTTFNPMNDFARGGRMIVVGATATRAGIIIAISFLIFCVTYFAMTLENYRNSSAQTRSLYTGFALMVAFFFGHSQTTTIFNWFQPLSTGIVMAGAGVPNPFHIYNSDVACGGGASCFSNMSYWSLVFLPTLVAAPVAYLLWFFVLRITSQSTSYSSSEEKAVGKAKRI